MDSTANRTKCRVQGREARNAPSRIAAVTKLPTAPGLYQARPSAGSAAQLKKPRRSGAFFIRIRSFVSG